MNPKPNPAVAVAASPLATCALAIASAQVGQREHPVGSNKGPMVNEYLASVHMQPGNAWCQAFVYWCVLRAAKQFRVECPAACKAGVLNAWNAIPAIRRVSIAEARKNTALILPGAQFFMDFGHGQGHTGFVETIRPEAGVFMTIEGNSNDEGSREGYEVCRRTRRLDDKLLIGFINYNSN